MAQYEIPPRAHAVIRPLQLEMAALRDKAREAERACQIALTMLIESLELDADQKYQLSTDGKYLLLPDEGEKIE